MNKQTIKAFLRPDKRKILAFLAVPLIMAGTFFVAINPAIAKTPAGGIIEVILIIPFSVGTLPFLILTPLFELFGIHPFPDIGTNSVAEVSSELIIFLSTVLWWYFISCLALFVFDKSKAKRATENKR